MFANCQMHGMEGMVSPPQDKCNMDAVDPDGPLYERVISRPDFVATLERVWGTPWTAALEHDVPGLPCMWDKKETGCLNKASGGAC